MYLTVCLQCIKYTHIVNIYISSLNVLATL